MRHLLAPASEVGEGAVGVGHAVRIFAFLYRGTLVVVGILEFDSDTIGHAHAFTASSGGYEPHHGQVLLALTLNFEWNLVVGTTHTARTSLHVWLDVGHSLLEDFVGVFHLKTLGGFQEAIIHEAFSDLLFAIAHNAVYETLDLYVAVNTVSWNISN
jgi:hypothetical protein